jgi:serine/threonine-protein kinase
MELKVGETRKARIGHGPLRTGEIVKFSLEIAAALEAAHARGIVHRDIKPANIFLAKTPHGVPQAKVLDFGLAKIEYPGNFAADHLTSEGATLGTVAYMSPEQARGELLDPRTDLFSLGVVMYEMATRHLPFPGATSALAFVQLLHHEPEPVRDWNDSVPRELERIILKLLQKDRASRFQTAAQLSAALTALLAKNGASWIKNASSNPPAVPLVRTSEPVAREYRPLRRPSGPEAIAIRPPSQHKSGPPSGSPALPHQPAEARTQTLQSINNYQPATHSPINHRPSPQAASGGIAIAEASVSSSQAHTPAAVPRILNDQETPPPAAFPYAPPASRLRRKRRRRIQIAVSCGLVLAAVACLLPLSRNRIFRPAILGPNDHIMIATIENQTGDKVFDGTLASALEIELQESPFIALRGADAYRSALHRLAPGTGRPMTPGLARQAAQAAGVKAYAFGSIAGSAIHGAYTITVEILDPASNRSLGRVQETAASRRQVPEAIDRIASRLRASLGEPADSRERFTVPLSREASPDVDALHAYALGDAAALDGRTDDAIAAFQAATALDPSFVQAHMQLSWLYRWQHAEKASAAEARLAEAATGKASDHTNLLAQYTYDLNGQGDLERAAIVVRHFVALFPHDPEGARGLARVLRLEGRLGEALDVAQRAIAEDPYDGELYGQIEFSLVGLDRYDAALAAEQQSQQLALPHIGTELTATYLAGRQDLLARAIAQIDKPQGKLLPTAAYGLYLDNTGQFDKGALLWTATGPAFRDANDLGATGPWLLAQGALDRGLAGQCDSALDMATAVLAGPQPTDGMTTNFNAGVAAALCGNQPLPANAISALHDLPESYAVNGFYLPDLLAAVALGQHQPQAALDALQSARPYDLISITPYLRGLAHAELHQPQLAVVDFQIVLGHRGIALTGGSDVFPLAQLAMARAYAEIGDRPNSQQAYRGFLDLWRLAPPGQPLKQEALAATAGTR